MPNRLLRQANAEIDDYPTNDDTIGSLQIVNELTHTHKLTWIERPRM